jgi:hypothetical protein
MIQNENNENKESVYPENKQQFIIVIYSFNIKLNHLYFQRI